MSVRLFALECGWIEGELGNFATGGSGRLRLPVPAWLVVHPRATVLFDSGMNRSLQRDAEARLGPLAKAMIPRYEAGEEVGARLRALDVDPARVDLLVNSHLHFDHCGGNEEVPNARLVVQRAEWEAGRDPGAQRRNFYDPREYDLGHDVLLVDGEHDLLGDGSVVCIPTPGHTAGHQSLRVVTETGPIVLTADACYFRRTLEAEQLPPFAHDFETMRVSLRRLRGLEQAGARLFFGHDPEQWKTLRHAPQAVV